MTLKFYQVDAFTSKVFGGNPAAVVPLENWIEDELMQKIGMENNLSETAFFVKENSKYHIRWFTPVNEVNLCGHATLASSYVIFNFIEKEINEIVFTSKSGDLIVNRENYLISLNFPINPPQKIEFDETIEKAFQQKPIEVLRGGNYTLVIYEDENFIRNCKPNFELVKKIDPHGVIISSKGNEADFVSRMFAPNEGIDEDPVTGSSHTVLIPYWTEKLSKKIFRALQVSKRGGELFCENLETRVKISGNAVLYATGNLFL
ncbi:MAG: PhzF family phenazine biosynthesis protein [Melioribacteraceae bacterium]|nr:PhzF family phenazine biosynthesis protein [Melioribacteraceae bacterium]